MDITISIEWLIGTGATLFASSFAIGYRYCKNLKPEELETLKLPCKIVDDEYRQHLQSLEYPIVSIGEKSVRVLVKNGNRYEVECRHFNPATKICNETTKTCPLVQSPQTKNQSQDPTPQSKTRRLIERTGIMKSSVPPSAHHGVEDYLPKK